MNHHLPKSVLITGVTGFIGNHLATRLVQDGVNVHAIIRAASERGRVPAGVTCHPHDGTTTSMIECLKSSQPDVVIHLASCFLARHTSDDIDRLVDSNLRFGLQLLEAMSVTGCKKMINTGTAWQHYENRDYDPVCLYAATKQAFEALITYYVNVHEFQVITLKLHDTYGPGDTRRKIVTLLVDAAVNKTELDLSPGEQQIDLTHVDDVISAFIIAVDILQGLEDAAYSEYMISSGNPQTLKEIALIIEKAVDSKIKANWGAREYREREVMIPWNKGKIIKNWLIKINLDDWLRNK